MADMTKDRSLFRDVGGPYERVVLWQLELDPAGIVSDPIIERVRGDWWSAERGGLEIRSARGSVGAMAVMIPILYRKTPAVDWIDWIATAHQVTALAIGNPGELFTIRREVLADAVLGVRLSYMDIDMVEVPEAEAVRCSALVRKCVLCERGRQYIFDELDGVTAEVWAACGYGPGTGYQYDNRVIGRARR